jgi:hypothetical protein
MQSAKIWRVLVCTHVIHLEVIIIAKLGPIGKPAAKGEMGYWRKAVYSS